MARKGRGGLTKLEIIRAATTRFLENGYSNTTVNSLSRELDISPGNFTFHFPQKDMLLAVLVAALGKFQRKMMEEEAKEGYSSVMAVCLEFAAMTSICQEDKIARDFYLSAYSSELCLGIIRENDIRRAKEVFREYCPNWQEEHFAEAEVLVSGIEEASLKLAGPEVSLETRIAGALNTILSIYQVPPEIRKVKIDRVRAIDYQALGRRVLKEFKEYVAEANEHEQFDLLEA